MTQKMKVFYFIFNFPTSKTKLERKKAEKRRWHSNPIISTATHLLFQGSAQMHFGTEQNLSWPVLENEKL